MNGDNNGHDEAFTDVKLEVPASTPTGDQPSYDRGERIKSEIGKTVDQLQKVYDRPKARARLTTGVKL